MKKLDVKKEEIQNLYFIGRNYVEHIAELKNEKPEKPLVFTKPLSTICFQEEEIQFKSPSTNIHYECELTILIGKDGEDIAVSQAGEYIKGIGLGVDFTDRKAQAYEKEKSIPWTLGKCQKNFTYVGQFFDKQSLDSPQDFSFLKESEVLQKGSSSQMMYTYEEIVSYISSFLPIKKGDLIFTGTPKGVGPVEKGKKYSAYLFGGKVFSFELLTL